MGSWAFSKDGRQFLELLFSKACAQRQMNHENADAIGDEFLDQLFATVFQIVRLHRAIDSAENGIMLFPEGGNEA